MATLLAYIFYFIAASASPLQRRWLALKRTGGGIGQIDFAFKTTLVIITFGLSLFLIQPFKVSGDIRAIVALAVICGVAGVGFWVGSFVAQKHVDAGITTLVSNIYTPITIILASVFLNEKLTTLQIVGTALLLFAILLISKKHRIGRFHFDKYFLLMVVSGVCLGLVLSAERALQKTTGFTAGTLFSWWAQSASLGLVALMVRKKTTHTKKEIFITGTLQFFQALSWVLLLLIVGNLSLVSAVTTFKVVVIFVIAALLLNEREDLPRKILGSLIAVAGLLLMK
ncbi:hypothetical protein A3G67_00570 [Candidatus Roizmanbacteria bacterium RIFCSPLOWO2_12_FULL_40_12]|uniref:EamA domain-containing protein n=1 Tax=Candidatus Roizmanbacteria bacterium RIFCSPLOWO2_01_FULL_40_42 TaxID=1802066 RepID=A0A1F7J665_9BACT|nr:MAG: hypothetical protein A2779_02050 [Candidatus Roizmanbacteria bacterium RIFCSPHIGHO2_01_FULL_40_98]OGK28774.1 MAG: hypothetical protein A3C31_03970 [Candidatus Roizmanbacteria bacterium RIFCSPHIGHO2_02_FULL_40_53]OGK29632.1 MAG: hypothetical protein A2W49_00365 [Candidatus Roizmanbacteria bacterium RIFCSPHIGHO2_12_41_18]OGK36333.1 MAG: hypothetical protein A3E69_02815 [Candidatus Roizmanbacteria bacterium RIFCSPHIGHO2_12_FULL_40_130]OGK51115.1 MAG: hypothetical protein A3B50_04945 [Candi